MGRRRKVKEGEEQKETPNPKPNSEKVSSATSQSQQKDQASTSQTPSVPEEASPAKVKADKTDKKKESKKNKKDRKKKTPKKKASDLSAKEIEQIKVAHTSAVSALSGDAKVSDEDKKVLAQLEKLKKQMDDGKGISMNLLKIAKDLFAEKNRQEKAAKEAEIKRKRDQKNEEKLQLKREAEIKEKNGQEKSTAAQSTQCEVCNELFLNTPSLKRHMQTEHAAKPETPRFFPCDFKECKIVCTDAGKLRRHRITHTGEKPYKCDVCGKGFGLEYNMKIHRRIHSGERPYKCQVCGKAFAQKANLNMHQNRHAIPGKQFGSVRALMVKQGMYLARSYDSNVGSGLNAYYKKKLQQYQEATHGVRPIFNIFRNKRTFNQTSMSKEDCDGDGKIHTDGEGSVGLSRLSPKEYLVELLIGIRKDLAQQVSEYERSDAERIKLERVIHRDYETEFLQIQSYQGLIGQNFGLEQLKQECEKISIVYDEAIERNLHRSRKALGQIVTPERLNDDPVQVKEEDFEESKRDRDNADINVENVAILKAER